jgi:hypothetical protein
MSTRYDHPNHTVRNENSFLTVAGNGAVGARFAQYQKFRLKGAHAVVVTAGTAAGHALTIKNGTTSVGVLTLGTTAAGGTVSATINSDVPSLTVVSATNGTDATGVALVVYETQTDHDADQTP